MMKAVVSFLTILLIFSNGYWLFASLDSGVTASYQSQELYEYKNTQEQLLKTFKEVASGKSKSDVVRIAEKYSETPAFDKDGCTWIGWLGFKFDEQGVFQDIDWTISYGDKSPCSISNNQVTQ
ncbi:hypothetical protein FE810_13825 [Thalassotalea litorea]|uniref:Uncharacterized protein n=1 Tax=Thalassotalea litorea TaxID=2020715 RepID=A0A5R9IGW6_9GAMM|nr:hypothetical protein [Thalassotalea litorea]TLU61890.1 hypothetical protein FE810_13825 [Thalassotalea litorea]